MNCVIIFQYSKLLSFFVKRQFGMSEYWMYVSSVILETACIMNDAIHYWCTSGFKKKFVQEFFDSGNIILSSCICVYC